MSGKHSKDSRQAWGLCVYIKCLLCNDDDEAATSLVLLHAVTAATSSINWQPSKASKAGTHSVLRRQQDCKYFEGHLHRCRNTGHVLTRSLARPCPQSPSTVGSANRLWFVLHNIHGSFLLVPGSQSALVAASGWNKCPRRFLSVIGQTPSPAGYMLRSLGFCLIIWGVFRRYL